MSDDENIRIDPLTGLDIEQYGKEFIERIVSSIAESLEKIGDTLEVAFEPVEEVAELMVTNKFKMAVKGLTNMFLTMMKSQATSKFTEGLGKIIGAILTPLKLLMPLMSVLAAIITESWQPTLEELMPIMLDLADLMLENKDIIVAILNPMLALINATGGLMKNIQAVKDGVTALSKALGDLTVAIGEALGSFRWGGGTTSSVGVGETGGLGDFGTINTGNSISKRSSNRDSGFGGGGGGFGGFDLSMLLNETAMNREATEKLVGFKIRKYRI
jgi:hypothetical protein